MAALRFRFAPPTTDHGAGDDNALTIKPDHSVGADQGNSIQGFELELMALDIHCPFRPSGALPGAKTSVLRRWSPDRGPVVVTCAEPDRMHT
jgi:hypothetical protein